MSKSILEIIKGTPIFLALDQIAAGDLARIVSKKIFKKDELLFSEGDDARALYILISGAVDLVKVSASGKEQFVRAVRAGEMFAEAAAFCGEAYPATAIARKPSEALLIEKGKFISFVRKNPEVSLKIMGAMAKLLRHLNNLVSELSLGKVASRLATFLMERAVKEKSDTFDLEIKKKDLAFKLGTIPETLSRNFAKLESDGVVSVKGRQIKIRNINKLRVMAGL